MTMAITKRLVQLLEKLTEPLGNIGPGLARRFGATRDAISLTERAWAEIDRQRWRDATFFAKMAVSADPNYAAAYLALGHAMMHAGDYLQARETLERGAELSETDPRFPTYLGDIEMKSQQYAEAEAAYRRALALRPEDPDSILSLAQSLEAQRRLEDAARLLERARQLAPGQARVAAALGRVRCQNGQLAEAIPILREAIALEETNPLSQYYLAYALLGMGKRDEARGAARRALELDPDNPTFRDLHARLLQKPIQANRYE